jgi:tetratricopeptide (TPR) repeat protein
VTCPAVVGRLPWALDLLGRAAGLALPGDPAGAAALELYGEVLHATGARDRALETLTTALAQARAHGQRGVAAHARLIIAHLDPAAGPVADIAREAADTFAAEGDHFGLARTHVRIGMTLQTQGRYERALGELDAALRHSVLAGADIERANALGAIGQSLWLGPGPAPDAVARCRALLDEYGDGRRAVQATLGFALTMLLAIGGSAADAADQLAVTRRAITELRYGESPVFSPLLEGLVAMTAGETGHAIAVLGGAHDAAVALGSGSLISRTAREFARALLTAGRTGEAAAPLAAVTAADGITDRADLAGLRAWRAGMRKDAAGARAWADEAVALARRTDSPLTLATACHDQARALLELGADARTAAEAARQAYLRKGHAPGTAAAGRLVI